MQSAHNDITHTSVESLVSLRQYGKDFFIPKGKIRSTLTGGYLSRFKGRGMEFSESRLYQPGDDIRAIDWRVTARTGKTHTKLYAEEKERPVLCLVDFRQPMFFATKGCLKSVLAAQIAALLAWRAVYSGDRIGGLIFSQQEHREVRPVRGQPSVLNWIHQLVHHSAWQDTKNTEPLETFESSLIRLRKVTHPGSFVYLVSDFRGMNKQAEIQLALLAQHNSLVLIFIYDPFEAELPVNSILPLQFADKHVQLNTFRKKNRSQYQQKFIEKLKALTQLSHRLGMTLIPCQTTDKSWQIFNPHAGHEI